MLAAVLLASILTLGATISGALAIFTAICASVAYLWKNVARPAIDTIQDASHAYKSLLSLDERFGQVVHEVRTMAADAAERDTKLDQRVTTLEGDVGALQELVEALRRVVGTRDADSGPSTTA